MGPFVCRMAESECEVASAFELRRRVFVDEQHIADDEEFDGNDADALQFVAANEAGVIGTARVRFVGPREAKLERMAVLKAFRRAGVGKSIVAFVNGELRKRGIDLVVLHAQCVAAPFYGACGFEEVGAVFLEVGIEHVRMEMRL